MMVRSQTSDIQPSITSLKGCPGSEIVIGKGQSISYSDYVDARLATLPRICGKVYHMANN